MASDCSQGLVPVPAISHTRTHAHPSCTTLTADCKIECVRHGGMDVLEEALEANPEDGQLQWRGSTLRAALAQLSPQEEQELEARLHTRPRRLSVASLRWAAVRAAVANGEAPKLLAGYKSLRLASQLEAVSKQGMTEFLHFVVSHLRSHSTTSACLDVMAEKALHVPEFRAELENHHVHRVVLVAMKRHPWQEDVQLRGCMALSAMAPVLGDQMVAAEDVLSATQAAMTRHDTARPIQAAAVTLLYKLHGRDGFVRVARELELDISIQAALTTCQEDGEVQWRGMAILNATGFQRSASEVADRVAKRTQSELGMQHKAAAPATVKVMLEASGSDDCSAGSVHRVA